MGGNDSKTYVWLPPLFILALPAFLYFVGYVYWDLYFRVFGLTMEEVQLPIHTVMFHSWHVLLIIVGSVACFYAIMKVVSSSKKDIRDVRLGSVLLFFAFVISIICFNLIDIPGVSLIAFLVLVFAASPLLLLGVHYSLHRPDRTIRIIKTGTNPRAWIPIWLVVIFVFLYTIAASRGFIDATKIMKGEWKERPLVHVQFTTPQNPPLPDSLFLIVSSGCYHFVLAPPNAPDQKPKIYAINKEQIAHFEILPPALPFWR